MSSEVIWKMLALRYLSFKILASYGEKVVGQNQMTTIYQSLRGKKEISNERKFASWSYFPKTSHRYMPTYDI